MREETNVYNLETNVSIGYQPCDKKSAPKIFRLHKISFIMSGGPKIHGKYGSEDQFGIIPFSVGSIS